MKPKAPLSVSEQMQNVLRDALQGVVNAAKSEGYAVAYSKAINKGYAVAYSKAINKGYAVAYSKAINKGWLTGEGVLTDAGRQVCAALSITA